MSEQEKVSTDGQRADTQPLIDRVPTLGSDFEAIWYSGTLGADRAPGPSSYWIDALITLPQGTGAQLAEQYAMTPTPLQPDVFEDLAAQVPDCRWLGADALNRDWSSTGWGVGVLVCVDRDQLVLTMKGQG